MKIFGIGYPKTGTTSLNDSCKILGYNQCKVFDYFIKWFQNNKNIPEILDDKFFCDAINENDVFSDWPFFFLYRELDKKYPGSKFILTVRKNKKIWQESENRHKIMIKKILKKEAYETYLIERKYLPVYKYEEHIKEVKEYFKHRPDDLLVVCFESEKGWNKLCKFLEVPEPKTLFPHANKSKNTFFALFKKFIKLPD